jgi:hypothetical protein
MVKRTQSKSGHVVNKQYQNFLKAFRDDDKNGIRIRYEKGFTIPNKIFVKELANEINNILNRIMTREIRLDTYKLLNPENINVIENGYTLLDNVVQMFTAAIDLEDEAKEYFLNIYTHFVEKLIKMGAVLNNDPSYPKTIAMNNQLASIINVLETVNPYAIME